MSEETTIEWAVSRAPVDYKAAVAEMQARAEAISLGCANERVWLLEHPPLYTAGTSARTVDLLEPKRLPVYHSGRGGQYTYHGPGQRVAYVMLDLTRRGRDVRRFVGDLERWLIMTLDRFGVAGETRADRVGIWVRRPEMGEAREDKIAAIGIRVRRWVSFHGVSLNVSPDLAAFEGIVPCGIAGHGVTSLADLDVPATMAQVDVALRAGFEQVFESVCDAPAPLAVCSTDLM